MRYSEIPKRKERKNLRGRGNGISSADNPGIQPVSGRRAGEERRITIGRVWTSGREKNCERGTLWKNGRGISGVSCRIKVRPKTIAR